MRGPQIFLNKLIANDGIPADCIVCNPTDHDVRLARISNNKTIIARLDGIHTIKASPRNILGILRQHFAHLSNFTPTLSALKFEVPLASALINTVRNRANTALLKLADGVVYQSKVSKFLHELIWPNVHLPSTVIYNGTDLSHFSPTSSTLPSHRIFKVGISANPFRPFKRLHHAIDIINQLNKRGVKTQLLILGNVDGATAATIHKRDLFYCNFHKHIANAELPNFLRQLDLFLFPSFMDPCPNSTIEALACGIPVVASSTCGIAEVINNYTSSWCINEAIPPLPLELCCEAGIPDIDVNQWADCVEAILRNPYENKHLARYMANSCLDIRITATKYREFILQTAEMRTR